ncbi:MAG: thiamine diphosphokinase [Dehalococcoidia bacterium]|nr:thiamine diphosphokinase [Dehalococcoidia bacterium]
MRALVIANGDPPSAALLEELGEGAALVVAADGGARSALALGLMPDVVTGDLDSIGDARDAIPADRIRPDADPNATDLEKAVALCLDEGYDAVDIIGAGGGRADHALANLSVLVRFGRRARVRMVDERFAIELVDGEAEVDGPEGTVVSLVGIGRCEGVTTSGLRWELEDASLDFSAYGVHNEIATSPARVSVRSGDLLLFRGRWVEHHA